MSDTNSATPLPTFEDLNALDRRLSRTASDLAILARRVDAIAEQAAENYRSLQDDINEQERDLRRLDGKVGQLERSLDAIGKDVAAGNESIGRAAEHLALSSAAFADLKAQVGAQIQAEMRQHARVDEEFQRLLRQTDEQRVALHGAFSELVASLGRLSEAEEHAGAQVVSALAELQEDVGLTETAVGERLTETLEAIARLHEARESATLQEEAAFMSLSGAQSTVLASLNGVENATSALAGHTRNLSEQKQAAVQHDKAEKAKALEREGSSLLVSGDFAAAAAVLAGAAATGAASATTQVGLALAMARGGDMAAAEATLCALLAAALPDAQSAQALGALGMLRLEQGRVAEALSDLQQAAALAPSDATILLNLGLAQYCSQEPGLALAAWQQAVGLDPAVLLGQPAVALLLNEERRRQALSHERAR